MLAQIVLSLKILGIVFILLSILMNMTNKYPRIPGDILIDKLGFTIRLPFVSALTLAFLASILIQIFNIHF